jgi:hypothetical protein
MLYATNQVLEEVASVDLKTVMLLKTLLMARDILLEELQKLSKAVDQTIEISEFQSKLNNEKILKFVVQANRFATDVEILAQGNPQNGLKVLTFIHAAECCYFVSIFFSFYFYLFNFLVLYREEMMLWIF